MAETPIHPLQSENEFLRGQIVALKETNGQMQMLLKTVLHHEIALIDQVIALHEKYDHVELPDSF